jgi:ABC-type spermidine/putrescine transport system permease subunit II
MRRGGWLALVLLLTPLAWAVWVSFTPDEILRPPLTRWSGRWYARFLADPRWTAALGNSCVPPVVLGMGLLPTMHALGLWGSYLSLVLAHGLLGMPLVFLTVQASLKGVPAELEQAARGLGAGPLTTFWRVTLPLCLPGLLAGGGLAFVLSLNEFFLALFLATPETETLPRVIWPELRYSLSPLVAVASVFTLALTALACLLLAAVSSRYRWFDRHRE